MFARSALCRTGELRAGQARSDGCHYGQPVRITLVFETSDSSRAAERFAELPNDILPCWVRTTLSEAAMTAVKVRNSHTMAATFELPDFYPADDPVGPDDIVFAPPFGIGQFSPLVPPPQHGHGPRLPPGAYVERIEQRVFAEKTVSLTRSISNDGYSDVDLRERAVNIWAQELEYDLRSEGIVKLTAVDHEWFKVLSSEGRVDSEAAWAKITEDVAVACDDRVFCKLTVLTRVPTDSLRITYGQTSVDAGRRC